MQQGLVQLREALEHHLGPAALHRIPFSPRLEPLLDLRARSDFAFPYDPGAVLPADADTWALLRDLGLSKEPAEPGVPTQLLFVRLEPGAVFPLRGVLSRTKLGSVILLETQRRPTLLDLGPNGARDLVELSRALPSGALPANFIGAAAPHLSTPARATMEPVHLPPGITSIATIPFGGFASTVLAPLLDRSAFESVGDYLDTISLLLAFDAAMREHSAWRATGLLQVTIREEVRS